jgi:hypothetical protein
MRIRRLKSTKHSDTLLIGDHNGPSVVSIATRLKTTDHGQFFKELVAKAMPEALKALDREIRDGIHNSPREASRNVATGVVHFCEDLTMAAVDVLQRNKVLGVPIPSYETLLHKLRGSDASQADDSGEVVSLFGQQEREP